MEKFVVITYLYDFYRELLTQKQSDLIKEYYFEDLTLSEIASKHQISRQSIYDTIKKTENKLLDYEKSLQLFNKYQKNQTALREIKKRCETFKQIVTQESIDEVIALIDEVISTM